jgi:uncharacterized protein YoxC
MDWAQILVIILAVFLAIFLLLAIVLTILLIKVTRQIKTVTGSAVKTAAGVEKMVTNITTVTSPVMLYRTIMKYVKKSKK